MYTRSIIGGLFLGVLKFLFNPILFYADLFDMFEGKIELELQYLG
jgi:hypothetical protein